MTTRLRVLLLEDNPDDARLTMRALERAGVEVDWERADSAEAYAARLGPHLDLILADFSLPQFDAPRALELLNEAGLDVPFIVVTGTASEEEVVECMKRGASDYLLKDRLGRLGHAVSRALEAKRDRDERRRALDALRESERRFRSLVETAPSLVAYLSGDRAVLELNPEAERVCGIRRDEAVGRNFLGLFSPSVGRQALAEGLDAAAQGRVTGPFEAAVGGPGGGSRVVLWTTTGLPAVGGQCGGIVVVGQDITERVQLEEQFRQAQRMEAIGRLAGGVAHDFNNLLTVIEGYCAFALKSLADDAVSRRYVSEVKDASARAASLTRQLLAFSRKQVLQPTVFNLNVTVAEMGRMLARLIGEDIKLEIRTDADLRSVLADHGQIEQVIANLVVNARDAMPDGGRITIETRNVMLDERYRDTDLGTAPGRYVMLVVSDTGCGIDGETMSRIFEPFFTTKDVGKGTGLGLSTVYGIVKQSGGTVGVSSQLGHGTVFKVYLPTVDATPEVYAPSQAQVASAGGMETILLVEDQVTLRALAVEALTSSGYTVVDAGSGPEALAICELRSSAVDLLITDVVLPGMNGREVAEAVAIRYPGVKALFMSGYTEDAIVRRGVLDEGIAFLPKPFSPDALAARVRAVLDS